MKLLLNSKEVKEAIENHVKSKLTSYQTFNVEILNILDEYGNSVDVDCEDINVEVGVSDSSAPMPPQAQVAPAAPSRAF